MPILSTRDGSTAIGGLLVAVVAFAFQQTSIVPAVQDVQQALHGTAEWSSWLVTVYLIVATVATPAMGRLGDLYGRRRTLVAGLVVFGAASAGAALAPNLTVLICLRAVQGVGGAVYPLALALARDSVSEARGRTAISLLAGAFGVGTAIGFVGGGALAQYVSWRAIFAVGAALIAVAVWLAIRLVPDHGERATGRFDVLGTAQLSIAAIGLLSGLTLVVSLGWRSPVTIGLLVIAVALAALWARRERRMPDPLVDLDVLRARPVAVANLATIVLGWTLFGSYLLIPQFARAEPGHAGYGLAENSAAIGLLLLPLAVAQAVASPLAGIVGRRVPSRVVFAVGLLCTATGMALLAWTRHDVVVVAIGVFVLGIGAGAALQAGSAVSTAAVAPEVAAVSAAVNSTVRRLAGGVGGQVNTVLLASFLVAGKPGFIAYTICYVIAGVSCVVGAGLVLFAGGDRPSHPGERSHQGRDEFSRRA